MSTDGTHPEEIHSLPDALKEKISVAGTVFVARTILPRAM
jgi:hypothetical protein